MKLLSIILFLEGENLEGTNPLDHATGEDFISKVIPNFWAFIVQFFAFLIMILIVIKLAYKPVKKFITERNQYISSNLEGARIKNEEATKNLEESKAKLQSSQKEAIQIIQNAKVEANKEREQILEETKNDVNKKIAQASVDIKVEQEKAMKEMHDDVVEIAMEATKNILGREVSESDDKNMIDSFVSNLIDEKNNSYKNFDNSNKSDKEDK